MHAGLKVRNEKFLVKEIVNKKTSKGEDFVILSLQNKEAQVTGKIWHNKIGECEYGLGKVITVEGSWQEYNGKTDLILERSLVTNEETKDYETEFKTMVFDIECAGMPYEELDAAQKEYLIKNLCREDEYEVAKKKTGLFSIFGRVCAIGYYCPETGKGKVLAIADSTLKPEDPEKYTYESFVDEKTMLIAFWEEVKNFNFYVTYNGDGFDWPYLMIRSGINRVKVSLNKRAEERKFLDLQNVLKQGRAFKLEMLCKAFGIENPKEEGVSGLHVFELFEEKKYQTIADYVSRDAYSTTMLYNIYKEYLTI